MNPTTKAAVIEALEGLDEAYCRAGAPLTRDERTEDRKRLIKARETIAALRSEPEPTLPIKGITRDDTVHGEEYFTRAQVEAMLREPEPTPEPGERDTERLNWIEQNGSVTIERVRVGSPKGPIRWDVEARFTDKDFHGETMRAALDAARASLPPAPTKGTPPPLR